MRPQIESSNCARFGSNILVFVPNIRPGEQNTLGSKKGKPQPLLFVLTFSSPPSNA
jgi:hypothetical protein